MVYHQSAQTIVVTIQHTVSNIPLYGTLRFVNYCIIEKVQANSVRIRYYYNIEDKIGIALVAVRLLGEDDS